MWEMQYDGGYSVPWDAGRLGWTRHGWATACTRKRGRVHPVSIKHPLVDAGGAPCRCQTEMGSLGHLFLPVGIIPVVNKVDSLGHLNDVLTINRLEVSLLKVVLHIWCGHL
jgi:hypothetical protein